MVLRIISKEDSILKLLFFRANVKSIYQAKKRVSIFEVERESLKDSELRFFNEAA